MQTVPDGQCFGWDILSHLCYAAVLHVHASNIHFIPMTGFRIELIRIEIELHDIDRLRIAVTQDGVCLRHDARKSP